MYAVDERLIADAVIARATVYQKVARVSFRREQRGLPVRSFRRDEHARSFHLERSPRLHRSI